MDVWNWMADGLIAVVAGCWLWVLWRILFWPNLPWHCRRDRQRWHWDGRGAWRLAEEEETAGGGDH